MSERKWRYGRPRPFWPWPVGFALVLFALGGAALAMLWGALERYEGSTPEAAILRSVQAVQAGEVKEEDVPAAVLPGRFATAAQYLKEARALLEGLPTDRDSLRFVRRGEAGGAEEYVVVDEEGGRAEFLLFPEEKGWRAWPRVQALSTVTIRAPKGVALTVDGRPLEESERSETAAVPGFEALGEAAPQQCVWQVEGLLEQPEVTAKSEAGSCRVEWETPLSAVVTVEPNGQDAASLEEFLDRTARVYARYVSADASFAELKGSLVPGTEFYNSLRTFDSSWYVSHDSTAFEEFSVSELESLGPDAAAGTVRFTYMVYKEGLRPRSYPSVYRMYAVREGEGWKLLDLQVQ
ncbi:hypothetical protein [Candidatus Allofournierella excrementigallinarum]|uniref:hypothetical protein n=1 Tax=Candidatus Allofournierella excrementigallinarum TaxID=2838592 RepID=UPI00374E5852